MRTVNKCPCVCVCRQTQTNTQRSLKVCNVRGEEPQPARPARPHSNKNRLKHFTIAFWNCSNIFAACCYCTFCFLLHFFLALSLCPPRKYKQLKSSNICAKKKKEKEHNKCELALCKERKVQRKKAESEADFGKTKLEYPFQFVLIIL